MIEGHARQQSDEMSKAERGERSVRMQERGRIRRQKLLDTAADLLEEIPLNELNLGHVAKAAEVPKASAYHFYKDIFDLYSELSARVGEELDAVLREFPLRETNGWRGIVADALAHGAAFLNERAFRRQLIWGAKVPMDIKRSDRNNDRRIARTLLARIQELYLVPEIPRREEIFYQAIEIADLLFCLCMLDNARLTDRALADAQTAATAYLGVYLPSELPHRELAETA
jgi:AcrR family transcriptional regulator